MRGFEAVSPSKMYKSGASSSERHQLAIIINLHVTHCLQLSGHNQTSSCDPLRLLQFFYLSQEHLVSQTGPEYESTFGCHLLTDRIFRAGQFYPH